MPELVFVTGASGFVGSSVISEVLERGNGVRALVHHRRPTTDGRVEVVEGDISDPAKLERAIRGCDTVIHLVGIIFEKRSQGATFESVHVQGTRNVVDATRRAGVKRYIHMSALGTRPDAVSRYHKTKFAAEEYVRNSGLAWTIFRPSLIHGPEGEFMQMEINWAKKKAPPFLFMPYFGAGAMGLGGAGKVQPIYVKDVARAFAGSLTNAKTIGEVYLIGGAQQLTWSQMHQIAAEAVTGKRRWVMPIPAWYAKLLTGILPGRLLPFNRDQVIMSQEDSTCDLSKFVDDFGWEPKGFAQAIREYVR
jgi:uncharacterized protein YbjT (DUF2867 family)